MKASTSDPPPAGRLGEFDIIARYFAPLAGDWPGALGLRDDAALLTAPRGRELVLTADMLVAGVHFRAEDRPEDVAWKALAVNVSDLVAKGADPMVYLLAIALPRPPAPDWLEGLAAGLGLAQETFGCRLVGGDTTATPGPVTLSITAVGSVPRGKAVRRAGARPGDAVYLGGGVGDAALGLRLLGDPAASARWGLDEAGVLALRQAYWQPNPPLALAPVLRAHASAAMDVSDGLVGDLRKLCAASGVGASIEADAVPLSAAARAALDAEPSLLEPILTGGDDYAVLATVPRRRRARFEADALAVGATVTEIGRVATADRGTSVLGAGGRALTFARDSHDHF